MKLLQSLSSSKLHRTPSNLYRYLERKNIWLLLAVALGFSYYPAVNIGLASGNAQLSIALVVFIIMGALVALAYFKWQIIALVAIGLSGVFYIYGVGNGFRLFLWLTIIAIALAPTSTKNVKQYLKGMIIMASAISLVAIYQLIGESLALPTGLNPAYDSSVFGFARPRAFFEEPQFLASFLLVAYAAGLSLTGWLKDRYWIFGLISLALVITMSRGAIVADIVGFSAFLLLTSLNKKVLSKILVASALGVFAGIMLIGVAGWQGSKRRIEPSYFISVYGRHMLGLNPDLSRLYQLPINEVNNLEPPHAQIPNQDTGSVENTIASADSRWQGTRQAWTVATGSPSRFIFGYGPGGYNTQMMEMYGPNYTQRGYVVNNIYAEVLVEYGIIGLSILLTWLAGVVYKLFKLYNKTDNQFHLGLLVLVIYGSVQQLFFSSLVNNLHFWVAIGLVTSIVVSTPTSLLSKESPWKAKNMV